MGFSLCPVTTLSDLKFCSLSSSPFPFHDPGRTWPVYPVTLVLDLGLVCGDYLSHIFKEKGKNEGTFSCPGFCPWSGTQPRTTTIRAPERHPFWGSQRAQPHVWPPETPRHSKGCPPPNGLASAFLCLLILSKLPLLGESNWAVHGVHLPRDDHCALRWPPA